jgi:hypothetical protein
MASRAGCLIGFRCSATISMGGRRWILILIVARHFGPQPNLYEPAAISRFILRGVFDGLCNEACERRKHDSGVDLCGVADSPQRYLSYLQQCLSSTSGVGVSNFVILGLWVLFFVPG